ncbi:mitochondrial carrier [Stereum hirsutum FP-91666 SS1]|uniref:mitochondrial carrier n=1 Tax=Stereum hirsutum (strain FP-91666) TaxID=721885 RepID=UPI000440D2C5|nr:mitochondrial carrier [Stereum hirsutum FP-91666 SS1]EIM91603.1 mitochondrial carrier [Stereum hirsutum FP-91666 SS1]
MSPDVSTTTFSSYGWTSNRYTNIGSSTFGPSTSSSPTSSHQLSQDRGTASLYASTSASTSTSTSKPADQAGSSGHEREGGEGKPSGKGKEKIKDFNHFVRSGVAGGIAGCVAKTVVAPLDRVKILFQASNPDFQKYAGSWSGALRAGAEIYNSSGVRGLLQGHSATLLRVFPYAAVKFVAYDQVHDTLMPTPAHETNFRRFSAGAISGAISVFLTYPLELIRVRMAFATTPAFAADLVSAGRRRPSFISVARHIYSEGALPTASASTSTHSSALSSSQFTHTNHVPQPPAPTAAASIQPTRRIFHTFPLLKFYRGFTPSLVGMIPYAGTSFLAWGFLRAHFLPPPPSSPGDGGIKDKNTRAKPKPLTDLAIGAVSGALAQTVSYPFEVVRRRMQVGGLRSPERWLGWRETIVDVYKKAKAENAGKSGWWRRAGWRGFYVGLGIGYLKVVPMNAVSFAVWVGMKRVLDV